jgi:5'-hydroxyaverantin dehydrogenase
MRSSVRINLVAPWYVDTGITKQADFIADNGAVLNMVGYAPMERVVDAMLRFAVQQELNGRAVGIFPRGNEDIGDDLEGGFGGLVLQKHLTEIALLVRNAAAKALGKEGPDTATQ